MSKFVMSAVTVGLLAMASCTTPPPGTGGAATIDCSAGESVNAAIAAGARQITINGVCDESVVVAVDGVTLLAGGPGAGIAPSGGGGAALRIEGAGNTVVHGLTFDGTNTANHAIAMRHSDAIFQDITVTGGKAAGIYVAVNSSANVQGSTLTGNDTAMTVINNSYANVTGGTRIENTSFIGIISSRASSVTFGGESVIDGVNSGEGVGVAASAHFLIREGARITNVTGDAIRGDGSVSVEIVRAAVTGNTGHALRLDGNSSGSASQSNLSGNGAGALHITADSHFRDPGGNTF